MSSRTRGIADVLPEDFVAYMETCRDETIIRRFSGKTLLRIAGLESARERQEVVSAMMEEFTIHCSLSKRT